MRVVLCDDDREFLDSLENKLEKYNCTISRFSTAESLKNTGIPFDIAFLDIELETGANGFQIVRFLRMNNPKCIIVFFTNYRKYAIKGYEYKAFRYILKNEPEQLIEKQIKEVFVEFCRQNKKIKGSYKDKTFVVALDEIYYIEVFDHILKIHSKKGEFEIYKQIKDMYEELCEFGFLRCHRSYIVNIQYIQAIKNGSYFIMNTKGADAIPIGIRYKDEVIEKYLNYNMGSEGL